MFLINVITESECVCLVFSVPDYLDQVCYQCSVLMIHTVPGSCVFSVQCS